MFNSKNLNPSELQNKLLTKSSNFLNSQNYILGKSEKKMVLSSFLSVEILKKVLSYNSFIYSIILYLIGGFFLILPIVLLFHGVGIIYIFVQTFFFLLISFLSFWAGKILYKKYEITSIKDYFIVKKEDYFKIIVILFIFTMLISFISIQKENYNYLIIILIEYFPLIALKFKKYINKSIYIFLENIYIYIFNKLLKITKINFINLLLSPLVVPLGFILYFILYIFSGIQKYKIIKLKNSKSSISNFNKIIKTKIFTNGFYEISKK